MLESCLIVMMRLDVEVKKNRYQRDIRGFYISLSGIQISGARHISIDF
jgi:hypothetical protein